MKTGTAFVIGVISLTACITTRAPTLNSFVSGFSVTGSPIAKEIEHYSFIKASIVGQCRLNNSSIYLTQAHYVRQDYVPIGHNYIVFQDEKTNVLAFWRTDWFHDDLVVRNNSIHLGGVRQFACEALMGEELVLLDGKLHPSLKSKTPNQAL